ncbi:MAG: hypothetical protein MHPDNHAH_01038 [Anaerolineales bacterium]|nr:hypothetical protein [Anaerolineales bacterium]
MWEFILGLLSNLASSWMSKLNIPRLFPNSQTKFWDTILRGDFVIVTPASEQEHAIKSQVFDFLGLDVLKTTVINKYYHSKYRQTTCDNVSKEWLQRNLILVAGPIPNTITRHILTQENKSVRYYFNGNDIIDKKKPKKIIHVDLTNLGDPSIDYGIISRFRNPFNREKWVVVASGMYGWGTYVALVSLTRKDILDFIREHAGKDEFQVLVETRVHNRIAEEPTLIRESLHVVTNKKKELEYVQR